MKKFNYQQFIQRAKQFWAKVKFEAKWRWEDIKHEHSPGIPDEPGDPQERKIPLHVYPKLFYDAVKITCREVYDDTKPILEFVGLVKKPPQPNEEVQKEDQHVDNVSSTGQTDEFSNFQIKFQHFVRSRFILIQTCIRQFLIGYNEGMGRDINEFKKKKSISEMVGSEMLDKTEWFEKVKTVAGGLKKFREEMHGIADVKDDQFLKEDLEKAQKIEEKDTEFNMFTNTEEGEEHKGENVGKVNDGKSEVKRQ